MAEKIMDSMPTDFKKNEERAFKIGLAVMGMYMVKEIRKLHDTFKIDNKSAIALADMLEEVINQIKTKKV